MLSKFYLILIYLLLYKNTAARSVIVTTAHNETKNRVLELVQVLFRDGERVPKVDETHHHSVFNHTAYFDGNRAPAGHLTDLGRFRARRLGRVLREKYDDFFGDDFTDSDVYAFASDQSSCRETMHLVLKELFDTSPKIRVWTAPKKVDVLMNSKTCLSYAMEIERVRKSGEVQKMMAKYDGLYRYIQENTGITFGDESKDASIYSIYKLLEAQKSMNLTLPGWCTEGVLNLLHEITFLHYNLESYTETLKHFNGGPMLLRFLENLKSADHKIQLYAAEDHNLAAFTRAMNKRFPKVPKYGSAVIVEKWREISDVNTIYVRIIAWTGVTEKLLPLQLKGCSEMCPLEDFVIIIEPALPSDDDVRCLLDVQQQIN